MGSSFFDGIHTIVGDFSLNQQMLFIISVSAGILMCRMVYVITFLLSKLLFGSYTKLSEAHKIEWNNRGFSTFHALAVAGAAFYLLLLSGLFQNDSDDYLIINRRSTLSDTVLGISVGYFLSDLGMIVWHYPALGGIEYVIHHGLSMFSIILSLISGQGHIYILMVLFSECTTPFVNLRWYLDVAGQKNTKLYLCNGFALFLGWLVARILLFIFFFTHIYFHFEQVKTVFPLGFYSLLVVPPMIALMNLVWFWKIVKGLIKTVSKARHQQ